MQRIARHTQGGHQLSDVVQKAWSTIASDRNRAEAETLLAMGLDIGITGWVTDLQRGQALREAVPAIPLDRLHLETDAPYLFPKNAEKRRGHNEPAHLPWVAASVAELVGRDVDQVLRACSSNSRRMFDPPGN